MFLHRTLSAGKNGKSSGNGGVRSNKKRREKFRRDRKGEEKKGQTIKSILSPRAFYFIYVFFEGSFSFVICDGGGVLIVQFFSSHWNLCGVLGIFEVPSVFEYC